MSECFQTIICLQQDTDNTLLDTNIKKSIVYIVIINAASRGKKNMLTHNDHMYTHYTRESTYTTSHNIHVYTYVTYIPEGNSSSLLRYSIC